MKRILCMIAVGLMVVGCNQAPMEQSQSERFTFVRVTTPGPFDDFLLIHDRISGREYLATYHGGFAEVTPKPEANR